MEGLVVGLGCKAQEVQRKGRRRQNARERGPFPGNGSKEARGAGSGDGWDSKRGPGDGGRDWDGSRQRTEHLSTSSHANKGQHLQKIGSCRVVRVQMLNDFWVAPPWPARPKPACCFPTKTCGLTRDGLASRLPVSPPVLGLRITKSRYLRSPLLSLQPSGPQNTAPSRAEGLNIPDTGMLPQACLAMSRGACCCPSLQPTDAREPGDLMNEVALSSSRGARERISAWDVCRRRGKPVHN